MRLHYRKFTLARGVEKIKARTAIVLSAIALATGGGAGVSLALLGTARAATPPNQVIVTSANTQGWSTADTRLGGAITFTDDTTAPGNPHNGALGLATDGSVSGGIGLAKAQYMHAANTPLASVTELSYQTKQVSASFPGGDASYQLPVCLAGLTAPVTPANPNGCSGFTTLVYEPYENGTVTPGVWQSWNVTDGQMWSSRGVNAGGSCDVSAGSGGAPFYTLAGLQAACPNAVVEGFGVNVGSNNPSYNVEADLVDFNGTTYNFEPFQVVTDKDTCKNGGWMTLSDASGNDFKNQGACVSYVASGGKSDHQQ